MLLLPILLLLYAPSAVAACGSRVLQGDDLVCNLNSLGMVAPDPIIIKGGQGNSLFGQRISINADGTIIAVGAPYYDGVNGTSTYDRLV